jgi:hypothetical protein
MVAVGWAAAAGVSAHCRTYEARLSSGKTLFKLLYLTPAASVRESYSFAPSGLALLPLFSHGLRPFGKLRAGSGLHSCAASRLNQRALFHREAENLVLTHTLKPPLLLLALRRG